MMEWVDKVSYDPDPGGPDENLVKLQELIREAMEKSGEDEEKLEITSYIVGNVRNESDGLKYGLHRDPRDRGVEYTVNFWITRRDVLGSPLAFIKPETEQFLGVDGGDVGTRPIQWYNYSHRSGLKYQLVPDMKKGQILVFKGCDLIHGAVPLVEQQGSREVVIVRVTKYV
jgi:hypothetical protein